MSVVIDNLTKIYGIQKALDGISFEAPHGKITGFLGTNGAGKSTTMKIASGYLSATSGTVLVGGLDVHENPFNVKQIVGYLPEHNPLYLEMYVKEYLGFVASAYKMGGRKKKIYEVIERCGLELEQRKKIGMLSKGYRQRVGLAQTLIHDPEVLVLDEPTSGLDPNQLVEIRKVIKEASKEKTVILSTHIMQEVEALCDKVVIIDKGQIVADNNVGNLKSERTRTPAYRVTFEESIDDQLFARKNLSIEHLGDSVYLISAKEDPRKEIMNTVASHSLPLVGINREEQSLENVFQALTGKA